MNRFCCFKKFTLSQIYFKLVTKFFVAKNETTKNQIESETEIKDEI